MDSIWGKILGRSLTSLLLYMPSTHINLFNLRPKHVEVMLNSEAKGV